MSFLTCDSSKKELTRSNKVIFRLYFRVIITPKWFDNWFDNDPEIESKYYRVTSCQFFLT